MSETTELKAHLDAYLDAGIGHTFYPNHPLVQENPTFALDYVAGVQPASEAFDHLQVLATALALKVCALSPVKGVCDEMIPVCVDAWVELRQAARKTQIDKRREGSASWMHHKLLGIPGRCTSEVVDEWVDLNARVQRIEKALFDVLSANGHAAAVEMAACEPIELPTRF